MPRPSPEALPDPGIEPRLLNCRQILLPLSYQESPHCREWLQSHGSPTAGTLLLSDALRAHQLALEAAIADGCDILVY